MLNSQYLVHNPDEGTDLPRASNFTWRKASNFAWRIPSNFAWRRPSTRGEPSSPRSSSALNLLSANGALGEIMDMLSTRQRAILARTCVQLLASPASCHPRGRHVACCVHVNPSHIGSTITLIAAVQLWSGGKLRVLVRRPGGGLARDVGPTQVVESTYELCSAHGVVVD